MSESATPIQLETIEGSLVSQDGQYVLLNCHSVEDKDAQIVIPTRALANLIENLKMLLTSAEIVMNTSDPIRVPNVQFNEPEPTFYVTGLGGTVRPETGLIQLRIAQARGPNFQISMMKEQSEVLYNLLLEVFATGDDKPH